MAYVDKLGVLRAQKLLPDKAMSQKKEVHLHHQAAHLH